MDILEKVSNRSAKHRQGQLNIEASGFSEVSKFLLPISATRGTPSTAEDCSCRGRATISSPGSCQVPGGWMYVIDIQYYYNYYYRDVHAWH